MKIVYCTNNIEGVGGFEKITILKANALAAIPGNEVYIIVTDHKGKILLAPLAPSIKLINLKINYYDDDWKPGFKIKIILAKKRQLHKKLLKKEVDKINPDVVIGTGRSEKFFLRRGFLNNYKTVIVRELHSATNYRLLLAVTFKQKLLARIQNFIDHKIIAPKFYDAIVSLTPQDVEESWKNAKNVYSLPNPLSLSPEFETKDRRKTVIAVGRLSPEKNFASLIRAFSAVAEQHPDWILEIYGEGPEREKLRMLIEEKDLTSQIFLRGQSSEIENKMCEASLLVLTSNLEGFALVLVEAMSRGLPVVSYDCKYGPSSIITDGQDGFLIKQDDEAALAAKLEVLISDEKLRIEMGAKGLLKSQEFLPEQIAAKWMDLFKMLSNKK